MITIKQSKSKLFAYEIKKNLKDLKTKLKNNANRLAPLLWRYFETIHKKCTSNRAVVNDLAHCLAKPFCLVELLTFDRKFVY